MYSHDRNGVETKSKLNTVVPVPVTLLLNNIANSVLNTGCVDFTYHVALEPDEVNGHRQGTFRVSAEYLELVT